MEEFDLSKSLNNLWEKLAEWMDSLILGLPNFILAVIVFILFVFIAKYAAKIVGRLLRFKVKQDSIREITVKVLKVEVGS